MEALLNYFKNLDTITDPELKLMLNVLKQKSGAIINEDTAWYWGNQKHIYLQELDIMSTEPLQYVSPETLVLFSNRISDIFPISKIKTLRHLNLIDNNLRFIEGIEQLTNLQELYLGDNLITNVNALSNMSNLKMLGLKNNYIKDISSLISLTGLVQLNLSGNPLEKSEVDNLRGKLPGCKVIF